jgi:hypothetical protein
MQTQEKTQTQQATPFPTEITNFRTIFRDGGKGSLISFKDKKIVLVPKEIKVMPGIPYQCVLKPMPKGNGFVVTHASEAEILAADLTFIDGKFGGMISFHNKKAVIAPENIEVVTGKEYECSFYLSGKGTSYVLISAKELPASKVQIIAHPYPVFSVEVRANDRLVPELSFDPIGERKDSVIENLVRDFKRRNFIDKDIKAKEYKDAMVRILGQHKDKGYSKNRNNF